MTTWKPSVSCYVKRTIIDLFQTGIDFIEPGLVVFLVIDEPVVLILKLLRALPYWAYFPLIRRMTGR